MSTRGLHEGETVVLEKPWKTSDRRQPPDAQPPSGVFGERAALLGVRTLKPFLLFAKLVLP